eukprot:1180165-Prorocentrum_minimum.AAC.4
MRGSAASSHRPPWGRLPEALGLSDRLAKPGNVKECRDFRGGRAFRNKKTYSNNLLPHLSTMNARHFTVGIALFGALLAAVPTQASNSVKELTDSDYKTSVRPACRACLGSVHLAIIRALYTISSCAVCCADL